MHVAATKGRTSYGKPPWIFKGSALYQLHLVKADTIRPIIPNELRLVEAFGYTLGGFFLANYEDSPVGPFHELVVIAGIVWNPPTSCAWAARVLVNSLDACNHGRKDVGLPSQVAKFSKKIRPIQVQLKSKFSSFVNMIGFGTSKPENFMDIQVTESTGPSATNICNISLAIDGLERMGPEIKMSLPSFSGRTEYNSSLLKYSCSIQCRILPVQPAVVSRRSLGTELDKEEPPIPSCFTAESNSAEALNEGQKLSICVMLSKPILALKFSDLRMQVEAPIVVSYNDNGSQRTANAVSQ